jgi:predicted metal-dependent enzyme (double-stranded beta helix superfamily)
MTRNSLGAFVEGVRQAWGPLSSEMVASCRRHLEELLKAPATDAWLAALHRDAPEDKELYRDPTHGFVLLAHTESAGLYRPPHDHGRGWVIYAVQQGEIEMATFVRAHGPDRRVQLVQRDATLVRPGQVKVFLPGDIHDTRCMTGPALLFRFTERDLKKEDKQERKVTRYVERDGVWTEKAAV